MVEPKRIEDKIHNLVDHGIPSPDEIQGKRRQLVHALHTVLVAKSLSVSLAESCTGGQANAWLVKHPHCSKYIWYSQVPYNDKQKSRHLNINAKRLDEFGDYSRETAILMADGTRRSSGCNIGLSTTGVAGPTGGSELHPVGSLYVGIANKGHQQAVILDLSQHPEYQRERFVEDNLDEDATDERWREAMIDAFAYFALSELLKFLLAMDSTPQAPPHCETT